MYVGKSLEMYGEYSEHETDLFSQINISGSTVIEVGANIGTQTVILSKLVGENGLVYAFEPQPLVFQNLSANLSINGLKNVRSFPFACGSICGNIHVPSIDYDLVGNFGGISLHEFIGEKVTLIKLDEWLDQNHHISMIKIDVEGMEESVILGLIQTIKRCKPILFVENDRIDKSKDLIELIWRLGYLCYWYITPLYNFKNYFNEPINVFQNLVSINMLCVPIGSSFNNLSTPILDSYEHPWRQR